MKLWPTPPEHLHMAAAASTVFTVVPILYVLSFVTVGHFAPLDVLAGSLLAFYGIAGLVDIARHFFLMGKTDSLWGHKNAR